jgi:hypothetical protein
VTTDGASADATRAALAVRRSAQKEIEARRMIDRMLILPT